MKELDFLLTTSNYKKSYKKTVELRNVSDVPAEFKFDYKEENSLFKVEPEEGTIKGQKYIYIYIYFAPKEHGYYTQELFCLVCGGVCVL